MKTINVRMKYSNFCEEEFDLKSWDELGAKRLDGDMLDDYDHEYEIQLPKKICEGKGCLFFVIYLNYFKVIRDMATNLTFFSNRII